MPARANSRQHPVYSARTVSLAPEHIGPYKVLRPIAAGGMAEVYEVQDAASGERFALKLLVLVRSALKRFDREYEAMTRLNHPGIVRVYHYGVHQGHPWLTMELLRGVACQSRLKSTGRPGTPARTAELLRVGYHLSQALRYVHDRGLIHRDIKSANVIVLPDGRVKLVDFGTAHLYDAMERITADQEFVGTFAYAAPEQIRAKPIDHRADLYALGVLLFRMATGRRPFNAKDQAKLIQLQLKAPPPDPRALVPSLPPDLAELILQMLAKKPSDRPAHAGVVAATLEALAGKPFTSLSPVALHTPESVSRGTEHRAIRARLSEGQPGDLILIEGEEGSDGGRLIRALMAWADDNSVPSASCRLHPSAPARGLLDMFTAVGTPLQTEAASRALETLKRTANTEGLATPALRADLGNACAKLVAERVASEKQPIAMFVHNLDHAGPVALQLFMAVRRALQQQHVSAAFVVTVKRSVLETEEVFTRRMLDGMRVGLEPMEPREVALAVGNMLGRRPPPADLARRIHTVTSGQPLFVEETVGAMVRAGGIEAEENRLEWADKAVEVPLPGRAQQAAKRTLEGLPVSLVRVLEALAISDDAAETSVVARALGWDHPELLQALEGLVKRGLITLQPGSPRPEWRLPLISGVVRDQIQPCRRFVLERRIARALWGRPASAAQTSALLRQGDIEGATHAAVEYARERLRHGDYRRPLEVLEPVVRALQAGATAPEAKHAWLLHCTCMQRVHPMDPEAGRSLARARTAGESDPAFLAEVELVQAELQGVIGHYRNYRKYLNIAMQHADRADKPSILARVATELGRSHLLHGQLDAAESWLHRASDAAEKAGEPLLLALTNLVAVRVWLARGMITDAESGASRSMQDMKRLGHRTGAFEALSTWSEALRRQGRYSEALGPLYRKLPEASQSEDTAPYVRLLLVTAWCEVDLARLGRAQECIDELAATMNRGEHLHLRLETRLLNAQIQLDSGQFTDAMWLVRKVYDRARLAELTVISERARALSGQIAAALGDEAEAKSLFQSALLGLMGSLHLCALSDGCIGRGRALAHLENPDDLFHPVRHLLEKEPVPVLRLEQLLARSVHANAHSDPRTAGHATREAAIVLNRMASALNDTDRAALRVHPWSRRIRKGLRGDR